MARILWTGRVGKKMNLFEFKITISLDLNEWVSHVWKLEVAFIGWVILQSSASSRIPSTPTRECPRIFLPDIHLFFIQESVFSQIWIFKFKQNKVTDDQQEE